MAIENSIMDKLPKPMNEWATYKPNDLVANAIGDHITGMGFYYSGSISEAGSTEIGIPVMLNVDLNGDDVDATMSENVIYCFINADKIDYFTKIMDPNVRYSRIFTSCLRIKRHGVMLLSSICSRSISIQD